MDVREIIHIFIGWVARLWIAVFGARYSVVLAYHSISKSDWVHATSPEVFEEQLGWLKNKTRVTDLNAIEQFLHPQNVRYREPVVAITFDDGYADWVTEALPRLVQHSMPATFFITTSFAVVTSVPHEGLQVLPEDGVKILADAGYEIGSHGKTHTDLSLCAADVFVEEVHSSLEKLRHLSGRSVSRLSYPKGRFSASHFPLLKAEGVTLALAGHGGIGQGTSPFSAPRVPVTQPLSISRFAARIYRAAAWGQI